MRAEGLAEQVDGGHLAAEQPVLDTHRGGSSRLAPTDPDVMPEQVRRPSSMKKEDLCRYRTYICTLG